MSVNKWKDFHNNAGGFQDTLPVNRWMIATGLTEVGENLSSGTLGLAQDLWNENPNTFQNASGKMNAAIGGGLTVATTALWAAAHKMSLGQHVLNDVYRHNRGGAIYGLSKSEGKSQVLKVIQGGTGKIRGAELAGAKATRFMQNSEKGFYRTKGFLGTNIGKGFMKTGFWRGRMGPVWMIVLPMLAEKVTAPVLSFAGKLLDEGFSTYHRAKQPYYDNRYFNTQQWQQNSYQQMGAAMNSYENNQMSIARIHHQR